MPENERQSEEAAIEAVWQKAVMGEGLTPSESQLLLTARGFHIQPTLPEPLPSGGSTPVTLAASTVAHETSTNVKDRLLRRDVRDLVTGENVMNFAVHEPTAADRLRISPQDMNRLGELREGSQPADIQLIVDELDRVLIPGFKAFLSPQECTTLKAASPALVAKIHNEVMRTFLASRADDVIAKLDRGIERRIVPLLDKINNPHARASIQECIDVWRTNRSNPYANFYRRTNRVADENPLVHAEYREPLLRMNPAYFSVGIVQGEMDTNNLGAAYSSLTEVTFLREPPLDEEMDFLKLLAAIHELTHKKIEARRVRVAGPADEIFQKRSANIPSLTMLGVIEEDPEAIANEVELMIAATGFGTLNVQTVAEKLGLSGERAMRGVHQILLYAGPYFKSGRNPDGSISPTFASFIEQEYRRMGARMFTEDASGILVEKL